jgi:hypothetical protein
VLSSPSIGRFYTGACMLRILAQAALAAAFFLSDKPITGNGISSTVVPDATALNAFASWPAIVVRMSSGGGFSLRGSHDLTDHGFVSGFVLAAMLFRQSVTLSLNPSFIFFSVSVSVYGFLEIWSVSRPTPNTDGEDSWDHSQTIPITKDHKTRYRYPTLTRLAVRVRPF